MFWGAVLVATIGVIFWRLWKRTKHMGYILEKNVKKVQKQIKKANKKHSKYDTSDVEYLEKMRDLEIKLQESRVVFSKYMQEKIEQNQKYTPNTLKEDWFILYNYLKNKLRFKKK